MIARVHELLAAGWLRGEIKTCRRCDEYCPKEQMIDGYCELCYDEMWR